MYKLVNITLVNRDLTVNKQWNALENNFLRNIRLTNISCSLQMSIQIMFIDDPPSIH